MKRTAAAALAAVVLLLVSACSSLSAGTITAKYHDPEYLYFIPSGKVLVPIVHPECWGLKLQDGTRKGDVCVNSAAWDRVRVGDRWSGQ